MPSTTRQRLVDASIKRFYRDGFRNVGIDQVLADVGISKTAFYKHFDSKEALMLAALESQHVWLENTFRDMVRQRGVASGFQSVHSHSVGGVQESPSRPANAGGCE